MSNYPGPQKRVSRQNTFLDGVLKGGILFFGIMIVLLTLQELLKYAGVYCIFVGRFNLLEFPLPGGRTSMTVFAGFISLLFLRDQFSYGLRPFLSYSCFRSKINDKALDLGGIKSPDGFDKVERVDRNSDVLIKTVLENGGGGIAIMQKVEYRISFVYGQFGEYAAFVDLKRKLASKGYEFNRDYWISSFSYGWSIAKEKEVLIFEMPDKKAKVIYSLDIKLEYVGLLGDRYEKQIYCIPRHTREQHAPALDKKNKSGFTPLNIASLKSK